MKKALYVLLQIVWGFPQTLVGFVFFLLTYKCSHSYFRGSICTRWKRRSSLSLGLFIFVSDYISSDEFFTKMAVHEYGHTIQSLIWGPLYLLTVGAPSMIWANTPFFRKKRAVEKKSYYSVYPEAQANRLGEKVTGLESPGMIL